jgi:hypothetical protein
MAMGRRSDFKRRPHDAYFTIDPRAVRTLLPYLVADGVTKFAEPCCGRGDMVDALKDHGYQCTLMNDLTWFGIDALELTDFGDPDAIITNPPWTRALMHPLIDHFQKHHPTWLLFDSDWAYNVHAQPFLEHCSDIVAIGRLRWMEESQQTGKDNCSWYRFDINHNGGPRFHGRQSMNDMSATETPAALIGRYIVLRDHRKAADEKFAEFRKAEYDEPMHDIEMKLLDILNKMGSDSIKSKAGTAYTKVSTSITTADGAEFRRHVVGAEAWDLIVFTPAKTAINEMIAAGEPLPPGLNRTTFKTVSINRPKGDRE